MITLYDINGSGFQISYEVKPMDKKHITPEVLASYSKNNSNSGLIFSFACDDTFEDLDFRRSKKRHAVNFICFDYSRN